MPARYETLASWANEFGWTKGAELGVFDGRTHLYLLDHCPQLHLIGVDVWGAPGFKEGPTKSGERCMCTYCSETRASRRARTISQMEDDVFAKADKWRSTLIVGETVAAAERVEDGCLNFVFVDGDHSEEGVGADIRAWLPKVRVGGRLVGHDANMRSVMNAVFKNLAAESVKFADDHLWFVDL